MMTAATPYGPILAGSRAPRLETNSSLYIPVLSPGPRAVVAALTLGWCIAFIAFWTWWLQPQHNVGWPGLLLNSALLFYLTYMPSYFLVVVNRLRRIDPALPVPDLRTAFVVTKAPSEPWPLARKTLLAMLAQKFPHPYDVWLCDENPGPEVKQWCAQHGVRISTRHEVAEYHRTQWPRRTRCKEGNLAYFYDLHGYLAYDVVAQLDCDHVPSPTYLAEMIRPFTDPAVGYVAAPSICDTNAANSWSARGRLYREATFHGPVQLGHSDGLAPSCIGSHYAVRTTALQSIGGIGPELAEDFSTSFLLTSAGWKSTFAHTAEAHGEGPHNLSAMVTQEFQWSRSLVMLLIDTVPQHLRRFAWPLRLRFLFALSYYPLLTLTTAAGLIMMMIAAVTGVPWVNVDYVEFLIRWLTMSLLTLAIAALIRSQGLLRPATAPLISWESWLYAFVRWPFIAWGVFAAVMQKFRPSSLSFLVTPKTTGGLEPLPVRLVLPYAGISAAMAIAALIGETTTAAFGYVFLCILGAVSYGIVTMTLPLLHALESARNAGTAFRTSLHSTAVVPLALAAGVWALIVPAVWAYPTYFLHFVQ
ncbi:glycosyltransferase family 2 protein [Arthrobacter sp. MDT1-65]